MKVPKLKKYRSMAVRRKWWIAIPFLFSVLCGLFYALATPRVYEAETVLLIQQTNAPDASIWATDGSYNSEGFRGIVEMVTRPSNLEKIRHLYLTKHPYLEDFAHSPSCQILDIHVERYIMVERFQNVIEYRMDHGTNNTT